MDEEKAVEDANQTAAYSRLEALYSRSLDRWCEFADRFGFPWETVFAAFLDDYKAL